MDQISIVPIHNQKSASFRRADFKAFSYKGRQLVIGTLAAPGKSHQFDSTRHLSTKVMPTETTVLVVTNA